MSSSSAPTTAPPASSATAGGTAVPQRRSRLASLAASWTFMAILTMVGLTILVWGGKGFPQQPMSFLRGPAGFVELAVMAVAFSGIGSFLANKLPGHAVGWSLIVIGLGVALHLPTSFIVGLELGSFRPIPTPLVVFTWLLTSAFVPLAVALMAYLLMILPDGRLPSHRWTVPVALLLGGFFVLAVATALEPHGLVWFPTLPNPIRTPSSAEDAVGAARAVGVGLLVVGLLLSALSMLRRYRGAGAVTRQQLRWIAGGAVVWVATLVPFLIVRYLTGASNDLGSIAVLVAVAGTLAVPISIFIATTRHHLFGVEAIIGRTLVYVPLMGICGGLYAAALALAQRVFVSLTGNTSDAAIILATLIMAAAITPVRRLLELSVDRLMSAGLASSVAAATTPSPRADEEYVHLSEQASVLAARLQEVEAQLSRLGPAGRDPSRDAGEPGVGRTGGGSPPPAMSV